MRPLLIALSLMYSPLVLAANQTVTLSVPGMTCPVCPITVKKALDKTPGVKKTQVDFKSREAVITYDDTLTSPDKLIKTATDAGYEATLKSTKK